LKATGYSSSSDNGKRTAGAASKQGEFWRNSKRRLNVLARFGRRTLPMRHPYPNIRGGGLFLVIVGMGLIVGGLLGEGRMVKLFYLSFLAACIALAVFGRRLRGSLGTPTQQQILSIPAAILLELILIVWVGHVFHGHPGQERSYILWLLLVIGIHFIVFALSMGPLMLLVAGLCILNAAVGLLLPAISVVVFWILDGAIKLVVGSLMLRAPRIISH
jgi:hypothetical protein